MIDAEVKRFITTAEADGARASSTRTPRCARRAVGALLEKEVIEGDELREIARRRAGRVTGHGSSQRGRRDGARTSRSQI